jgi:hypothetical protein
MDDSLEQPDAKPPTVTSEGNAPEDVDQASDDEGDVVLDWTKLVYVRAFFLGFLVFKLLARALRVL